MADTLVESLFGFLLREPEVDKRKPRIPSPFPPMEGDGGLTITDGIGAFNQTNIDYGALIRSEIEMITRYRQMAMNPLAEYAINDILNELIVYEQNGMPVKINLNDLDCSETIKNKIREEFNGVLKLLNFKQKGHIWARRWYVDGRIYFHKMIDVENVKSGIQELRYIDPRQIMLVQISRRGHDTKHAINIPVHTNVERFFVYNPMGLATVESGLKIARDSIAYAHSGVFDSTGQIVVSNLHKAIRPLNQLRMMEDALVIYRLVRAPERRVFTIDVEDIPPAKVQEYLEKLMRRYKNKIVYNSQTGEIDTERRFMTMTDDFFLPQRAGKGTRVDTLPGGEGLGEITDVEFFREQLYRALNVPLSRMNHQENGLGIGRPSEITRDELMYQKFIDRQRQQFSTLFDDLMRTQLVLKGITTLTGWNEISQSVSYDFQRDNLFTELKEAEMWSSRLGMLGQAEPFIGNWFSRKWAQKTILRQSEDEIAQLEKERKGEPQPDMGFGFGDQNMMPQQQDPNMMPQQQEQPPQNFGPPPQQNPGTTGMENDVPTQDPNEPPRRKFPFRESRKFHGVSRDALMLFEVMKRYNNINELKETVPVKPLLRPVYTV